MLAILALFTAASVVYGVVQDLVLVQVCPEFFAFPRRGEPDLPSPMMLALRQGVMASWWGGAMLGVALAIAARIGKRPGYTWKMLIRPAGFLLGTIAIFSALAGIAGYLLASAGNVVLTDEIKKAIASSKWSTFQSCWFTHMTSYYVAFVGGSMQVVWVWLSRKRLIVTSRVGY